LRQMINKDDQGSFEQSDNSWTQIFEFWRPELARPGDMDIEALVAKWGSDDTRVLEARRTAESNRRLSEIKSDLLRRRLALRFGLLAWSVRRALGGELGAVGIVRYLCGAGFSQLGQVAEGADAALELYWAGGHTPWTAWFLEELPEGRAHSLGVDEFLLRAFVVASLVALESNTPGSWCHSPG